ncbi:MAG: D-alanyl-D-alanine carboxypeptidase [Rhodospirillales bacterium]|nr:D-alanyl-D-alanine carboxypeptidase [Rhodospirillales bacterium]
MVRRNAPLFLYQVVAIVAVVFALFLTQSAQALDAKARAAIMIDAGSGALLFAKNADVQLPPASMSKLMTAFIVFERLSQGLLTLKDQLPVSEKAWRMGGSKMFVEVGASVSVEDLLRGMIVQSGNDAAIVLAEGLAGSEAAFVREMNETAQELGLTGSSFANVTGWPDPNHRMTPRDLATLARILIERFPQLYRIYAETEFTWNDISQGNRNPLLYRNIGADGLKTGHTREAGYCLVASAVEDGRRLILVVMGLETKRQRAEESERLLAWGFREFAKYRLFQTGEMLDEAPVWMGGESSVPLVAPTEISVNLLRANRSGMSVKLIYQSPLAAPIQAGEEVAILTVAAPDTPPVDFPIVAGRSVREASVVGRLVQGVTALLTGG